LEQACTEHRVCEITYQALDETEPSLRTIHPYSIAIRGSQWYLIAQDEAKDEFRLYHFLRIKNVEMLDHLFKKDEAVQIDRFFEDSWSVFQGKKQMVRLKARGVAARLLSERASPKRIELEWIGPDEGIAEIEVRGEQEILNWALSMGPDVEILEPATLRDRLRQQLTATLHNYE
jgi:proteasome accessory factor B